MAVNRLNTSQACSSLKSGRMDCTSSMPQIGDLLVSASIASMSRGEVSDPSRAVVSARSGARMIASQRVRTEGYVASGELGDVEDGTVVCRLEQDGDLAAAFAAAVSNRTAAKGAPQMPLR